VTVLEEARDAFQQSVCGTGCDDGTVILQRCPGAPACQYQRGACIEAVYGGRKAQLTSNFPVSATTRVSFLFGAMLNTPEKRTAASAIMNVVMNFLCLARTSRSCLPESFGPCRSYLEDEMRGVPVFCSGFRHESADALELDMVEDPEKAEVILISGNGVFSEQGAEILERYRSMRRIVLVGPETAALASLLEMEHWCPFGRQ
jgi:small basic protein